MRISTRIALGIFLTGLGFHAFAGDDPVSAVNVFAGTDDSFAKPSDGTLGGGSGGSTNPAAVVPFGMIQWGPNTVHAENSGYRYGDRRITGFALTHLSGAGCRSTGDLPFLPFVGDDTEWDTPSFSHKNESASPGYYHLTLDSGVSTELAVTERTGMARFKVAKGRFGIAFNPLINGTGGTTGEIKVENEHTLTGNVRGGNFCHAGNKYQIYFVIEFDQAIRRRLSNYIDLISFNAPTTTAMMKIGMSYVSVENARLNLKTENPGWDFSSVQNQAAQKWSAALNKIRIDTTDTSSRRMFYTALYHSLLYPNILSDVNGEYTGFDKQLHQAADGFYGNFSGWDVYRTQTQLLAVLFPERASAIANSLVSAAEQCGAIPKWSQNNAETGVMVGDPGPIAIANFYAFGATDFDRTKAIYWMNKDATDPKAACQGYLVRPGLSIYQSAGYLPSKSVEWGPVATTLEYSTSDFAISAFAKSIGEKAISDDLLRRSGSWKNLWDGSVGYLRSRDPGGRWHSPFDPATQKEFVEGNSAQYSWVVPQDLQSLTSRMGSDAQVEDRLTKFMSKTNAGLAEPYLFLGNEPGFMTPFVFLWIHHPEGTQKYVRNILRTLFRDSPDGLPGNDDLGAMSAWYVWAALGIYPEIPGIGGFAVTSPLFSKVEIDLSQGHTLTIQAAGAEQNPYIQKLKWNGQDQNRAWLDWPQIKSGGNLNFELNQSPSRWGSATGQEPPSFSSSL